MKNIFKKAFDVIRGKRAHQVKRSLKENVFYPAHDPRTESRVFRKTKKEGHKKNLRCVISGHPKVEYHHMFCEWAFANAVDWETLKKIGTGEIKHYDVYDPDTMKYTGEKRPIEESLVWLICKFLEWRGFNWDTFNPKKPETLVDSLEHMLTLHEKFHRGKDHGIHNMSAPIWFFQALPKVPNYVMTPDDLELLRKHGGTIADDEFKN